MNLYLASFSNFTIQSLGDSKKRDFDEMSKAYPKAAFRFANEFIDILRTRISSIHSVATHFLIVENRSDIVSWTILEKILQIVHEENVYSIG